MATVAVYLKFLDISFLGQEISIILAIGVAVAAGAILLVSVLASKQLLQRYPATKILTLANYVGQIIEETIFLRRLRYTFSGPHIIQVAYENVSELQLVFSNNENFRLTEL